MIMKKNKNLKQTKRCFCGKTATFVYNDNKGDLCNDCHKEYLKALSELYYQKKGISNGIGY